MSAKASRQIDEFGCISRSYSTVRFQCCSDGVIEVRKERRFRKPRYGDKTRIDYRKIWKQKARNKKKLWTH